MSEQSPSRLSRSAQDAALVDEISVRLRDLRQSLAEGWSEGAKEAGGAAGQLALTVCADLVAAADRHGDELAIRADDPIIEDAREVVESAP